MPQLIAMVIVVVGAMIYMFQTFGGTGDKIEGIAQKTSVITEINNIKNGLKLAAKSGNIGTGTSADTTNVLLGLAELAYFPEQMNSQITNEGGDAADARANTYNKYYAISFGGEEGTDGASSAMTMSLVAPKDGIIPGIYVEFAGSLASNAGFLETQIANDLKDIAYVERSAAAVTEASSTAKVAADATTGTALDKRLPSVLTEDSDKLNDGKFIIYFNDFGSDEVVVAD